MPDGWLRYFKLSARSTGWPAWATLKTLLNSSHVLFWYTWSAGAFAFTQTAYLLKLVIQTTNALTRWRLNVETKTKRTLYNSRRLSFNELTKAKNLVLHSSHFALCWRCCTALGERSSGGIWKFRTSSFKCYVDHSHIMYSSGNIDVRNSVHFLNHPVYRTTQWYVARVQLCVIKYSILERNNRKNLNHQNALLFGRSAIFTFHAFYVHNWLMYHQRFIRFSLYCCRLLGNGPDRPEHVACWL